MTTNKQSQGPVTEETNSNFYYYLGYNILSWSATETIQCYAQN